MTKYENTARLAIATGLEECPREQPMWEIVCLADNAVREAGLKRSLYASAAEYGRLLPAGWSTRWITRPGGSTRVLHACPPDRQTAGLMKQRNHEDR